MRLDPTLLSPVSALLGALIGGTASLLGSVFTQSRHDRQERISAEVGKREGVYADFVMHASNMLLNAYTRDGLVLTGDEQRLVGLIHRMRLFAPVVVVEAAEAVLRGIVAIALEPSVELRKLATEALAKRLDPDPLLAFSLVCRADLDQLRGHAG